MKSLFSIKGSVVFLNIAVIVLGVGHLGQSKRIKTLEKRAEMLEAAVAGNPQIVSRVGNYNEFHLVFTNFNSAIGAAVAQSLIRERQKTPSAMRSAD